MYKFICDPRALFSLAGFGGDNTAAALHYHAAAAAAGYPGMHGHASLLQVKFVLNFYHYTAPVIFLLQCHEVSEILMLIFCIRYQRNLFRLS